MSSSGNKLKIKTLPSYDDENCVSPVVIPEAVQGEEKFPYVPDDSNKKNYNNLQEYLTKLDKYLKFLHDKIKTNSSNTEEVDYTILINEIERVINSIPSDYSALVSRVTTLESNSQGEGLSQTEKALVLSLFTKAVYTQSDASSALAELRQLWVGFSITWNGSNFSKGNSATAVSVGSSFTSTVTANARYELVDVTVTMGGSTVQGAWNNGTVTIPNVTGDIVITVTTTLPLATPIYLGRNLTFDGTASTVIDTGVKLCDTDKDVTIIVQLDTPVSFSGSHLLSCCAGSTGKDGYYFEVRSSNHLRQSAFEVDAGIAFSNYYNSINGAVQVLTLRHRANSGTVETCSKISSADGDVSQASVANKTSNITFATHEQNLIIGARRWNGINGYVSGTVKSIEVYDVYFSDEQLASYYE